METGLDSVSRGSPFTAEIVSKEVGALKVDKDPIRRRNLAGDEMHGGDHVPSTLIFPHHVGPMRRAEQMTRHYNHQSSGQSSGNSLTCESDQCEADSGNGKGREDSRMAGTAVRVEVGKGSRTVEDEGQQEEDSHFT